MAAVESKAKFYSVRRLLAHRTIHVAWKGPVVHFLVDWQDYGPKDRTWEPANNILTAAKKCVVFFFALAHWQVLCKAHLYAERKARSCIHYCRQHTAGAGQERAGREAFPIQQHDRRRFACVQLDLLGRGGRRRQEPTYSGI